MISTLVFYNLLLLILIALNYNIRWHRCLSFIILLLVSGLRFDIGNDYQIQAQIWDSTAELFNLGYDLKSIIVLKAKEPISLLLIYIFKTFDHPSKVVFFVYTLIQLFFIYKTFKYNNCFREGIFIYFTLLFIFYTWDWTRQGVAMSIFLYSYRYIDTRQPIKYFICIITASLFHYSSLVLIPFYFVNRISINRYMLISIVVLFLILSYSGLLSDLPSIIINLGFYDSYTNSLYSNQIKSDFLIILFKSIISIVFIYSIPKKNHSLINIIFIGSLVYIISSQNLLLERISCYFSIYQTLAFTYIVKNKSKIIYLLSVCVFLLFFNFSIFNVGGTRGAVPYDFIFSENGIHNIYRERKFL